MPATGTVHPAANPRTRPGTRLLWLLFALLAATAAGWTSLPDPLSAAESPPYDPSRAGGTLRLAVDVEPTLLNPVLAVANSDRLVSMLIFDGLLTVDDRYQFVPRLAESIQLSADGLVWTIRLRQGVLWHDRRPFTSADVLFTYGLILDRRVNSPWRGEFQRVVSLEAPDPYTVRIRLSEPYIPFLNALTVGILPKHKLESVADLRQASFNTEPVGTGPYQFSRWDKGKSLTLRANRFYYLHPPYLQTLQFQIVPDSAELTRLLLQGDLDASNVSPTEYAQLQRSSTYSLLRQPRSAYTFIGFNQNDALFADVRVRRAIAHAIDRAGLGRQVLQSFATLASSPFPYISWAYEPSVTRYGYDPDRARRLLDEAGWRPGSDGIREKDGRRLSFTFAANDDPRVISLVTLVSQQLRSVGIEAVPTFLDPTSYFANLLLRNFEMFYAAFSAPTDPDLYDFYHSAGKFNFFNYKNPEVDRLIEQARVTADPSVRKQAYSRIQQILAEDVPAVLLFFPDTMIAVHKRIAGPIAPNPAGSVLWNVEDWYLADPRDRR